MINVKFYKKIYILILFQMTERPKREEAWKYLSYNFFHSFYALVLFGIYQLKAFHIIISWVEVCIASVIIINFLLQWSTGTLSKADL